MTDLRALAAEVQADPAPLNAYTGRSLADAFAAVVLRDSRFWDATRLVLGRTALGMTCASGGVGLVWPSRSGLWPVKPGWFDLVAGWLDPEVVTHGIQVDADGEQLHMPWAESAGELTPIHDAADVVAALLGRFLAPLRDGRVVASGHAASGGMVLGPISPAVWSRPATRFDAINSGVARWTGWSVDQSAFAFRAKRFRFEEVVPEFEAVTLDLIGPAQNNDYSPKRGRPRQYSYAKGMNAVLVMILRSGLPKSGKDLCKMLEKELIEIDHYSPDLERLAQDIAKRDETIWKAVAGRSSK